MNWEKLTRDFRENRCILLLGPHLATVDQGGRRIPLHEKPALQLTSLLATEGIALDEKEQKNLTDYLDGSTLAVKTVAGHLVKPVSGNMVLHIRELAS